MDNNLSKIGAIITGQNAAGNAFREAIVNDSNELHVYLGGSYNEGVPGPLSGYFQTLRVYPVIFANEELELIIPPIAPDGVFTENLDIFSPSDIAFNLYCSGIGSITAFEILKYDSFTTNSYSYSGVIPAAITAGNSAMFSTANFLSRPLPIGRYKMKIYGTNLTCSWSLAVPYTGEYRIT